MKLYSVREAAEQINMSAALVYALVAAKKIRHERHGMGRGRIRIPADALEEYRQRVTVDVGKGVKAPLPRRRLPPLQILSH